MESEDGNALYQLSYTHHKAVKDPAAATVASPASPVRVKRARRGCARLVGLYSLKSGLSSAIFDEMREIWIQTGEDLERERTARGLTPDALARLAGLSGGSHVRQIERGLMNPQLSTVLKLTAALNSVPPS